MVDTLSPKQGSLTMAKVRNADTKPEMRTAGNSRIAEAW